MYLQNNVSRLAIILFILFCSLLFSFTTALADTDLSVSITDLPDSIIPGQDVTLNLKVMNNGPSPASNVVVSGTLPPGASFRGYSGAGWKCGPSGSGGACTLSTLNVGKAPDLNVVVKSPVTSGNITFPAIVSSNSTDTDTSNNSYSTIISLVGETGDFCVRDYRSGAVSFLQTARRTVMMLVSSSPWMAGVPATATAVSTTTLNRHLRQRLRTETRTWIPYLMFSMGRGGTMTEIPVAI
jgi:uncharacterized repeat protein (TIGR01451 family)